MVDFPASHVSELGGGYIWWNLEKKDLKNQPRSPVSDWRSNSEPFVRMDGFPIKFPSKSGPEKIPGEVQSLSFFFYVAVIFNSPTKHWCQMSWKSQQLTEKRYPPKNQHTWKGTIPKRKDRLHFASFFRGKLVTFGMYFCHLWDAQLPNSVILLMVQKSGENSPPFGCFLNSS